MLWLILLSVIEKGLVVLETGFTNPVTTARIEMRQQVIACTITNASIVMVSSENA